MRKVLPYLPLIAAAVMIPWIVLMTMALIFSVGDTPYVNTPEKENVFGDIAIVPALAGLVFGLIAVPLRLPQNGRQWVWLLLGIAACVLWVLVWRAGFIR